MLRGWSKAAGAQQALALGWTAADLFGCDRRAPWHRLDRAGLVLLTGGHEIVELTADVAALRTSTGSVLRYPAPTAGEAARGAAMGAPDLRSGHRATDPRADSTSERRADGGDVLGRTPPPS